MRNHWTQLEPQERCWLTQEGQLLLKGLGMRDPLHDPCTDEILDSLEELIDMAENEYLKEIIEYVIERLEDEM